jgi:hypothetical protein
MFTHSIIINEKGTLLGEWLDETAFRNSEPPLRTWWDYEIEGRKVWPNSQAFLTEFTFPEMAAISLSADPTIAALRLLLSAWAGEVYSDDERVQTGLDALVATGILTEQRRAEILALTPA